jgi:hypothetical protein
MYAQVISYQQLHGMRDIPRNCASTRKQDEVIFGKEPASHPKLHNSNLTFFPICALRFAILYQVRDYRVGSCHVDHKPIIFKICPPNYRVQTR